MRIAACAEHLGNAVSLHGMWLRGALPAQNVSECCLMRGAGGRIRGVTINCF